MYKESDTRSYFISETLTQFSGHPLTSPFKLPQSVNENVEIEPLRNDAFPSMNLSLPIFGNVAIKCKGQAKPKKCQRIWGYREIFMKRERISYLLLQIEETLPPKQEIPRQTDDEQIKLKSVYDYDMCCGDCHCNYQKNRPLFSFPFPAAAQNIFGNKIATGGGTEDGMRPNWLKDQPAQNQNKGAAGVGGQKINANPNNRSKNDNWGGSGGGNNNSKGRNDNNKRNSANSAGGNKRNQSLLEKLFKKNKNKTEQPNNNNSNSKKSKFFKFFKRKNSKPKKEKPKKPLTAKQLAKKRIQDEKDRVTVLQTHAKERASQFTLVEPNRDKVEREQEFEEPEPNFEHVLLIEGERRRAIKDKKMIVRQLSLGSHLMFLIQEHQKDNEWLQLSASSDGEAGKEKEQRKLLVESREKWANPSMNYPSQKMFRSLMFFFFLLNLTLRNPFTIAPCFRNQIVMVHMFRSRMLLFCCTTLILWVVFCFTILNAVNLYYGTEEDDLYQKMECNELELYYIFFWGYAINLFLAASWSLLVLVNYSLVIANYYNLWSKAMPFLDMNPAYGVKTYIRSHSSFFLLYMFIVTVSFAINWPIVTRGTFGQVFVLTFRQMFPRVRMIQKKHFFWGQFGGLILYLYCIWVNRTIFMFLHQFSLFLRNACQQWNLNFALRFQLVTTYYRAHLMRISTQGSLINLYNQHRIIVGLCNYYGKAFIHPLFIYMVVNMAVVTLIMIFFIKYEEIDPATFDYNFLILFDNSDAVIYHTLPKQDELTGVVFLLLQCCIDFFQGTIGIGWGSDAIVTSFEFVRRQGLLQCNSRHERRLIHSLFMSFSDIRSPLITANGYFGMTRRNIFTGLMSMLFFWTMIIQCSVEQPSALIEWVPKSTGTCEGLRMYEDSRGLQYCMQSHKYRHKMKRRLLRNRMIILEKLKPMDTATRYLFRGDCSRQEILDDMARIVPEGLGMCKVTNINMDLDKFGRIFPRSLDQRAFDLMSSVWEYTRNEWKPPKDKSFQTDSVYPCDIQNRKFGWMDYQRDFYRVCYSEVLKLDVVVSVVFHTHMGNGSKVAPVELRNEPEIRDCGINPYIIGEEKAYVTCSGTPVQLDDCGSPNSPDFSVMGSNKMGTFRSVRLKTFTLTIPNFPEAYKLNGFSEHGSVHCWDSPVASEKCKNLDMLKYCKISKNLGVSRQGYLFGNDCYNFKHFTVFVQPERSLFCLHPRNDFDPIRVPWPNYWMSVDEYNRGITQFQDLIAPATTTTTTTTTPPTTAPPPAKKEPPKDPSDMSARAVQQVFRPGAGAGAGAGLGRAATRTRPGAKTRAAQINRSKNRQAKADTPSDPDTSYPRRDLLKYFFPCKDDNDQIVGWLPLPFIVYDVTTWNKTSGALLRRVEKRHMVGLDSMKTTWDHLGCWEDPYPVAVFRNWKFDNANYTLKEVQDWRGLRLLDECYTAWFVDKEYFIPEHVFAIPEVELIRDNDTMPLCWDNSEWDDKCNKNDCFLIDRHIRYKPSSFAQQSQSQSQQSQP